MKPVVRKVVELEPLAVNPAEAARLLGLSRSHVYELMASGTIPYLKAGRSRRVPVEALKQFIAEGLSAQRLAAPSDAMTKRRVNGRAAQSATRDRSAVSAERG